jgi:hypothetical protein
LVALEQKTFGITREVERSAAILVLNIACLGIDSDQVLDHCSRCADACRDVERRPVEAIARPRRVRTHLDDFGDYVDWRIVSYRRVQESHTAVILRAVDDVG